MASRPFVLSIKPRSKQNGRIILFMEICDENYHLHGNQGHLYEIPDQDVHYHLRLMHISKGISD